jgi:hypothetical protein
VSDRGPFVKVYSDLASDKELQAREWRTYWNIFTFQRDKGEVVTRLAFPSHERLAKIDGSSTITIKRAVSRLVDRGHIVVGTCRLPNGGLKNVYWQAFRGDPLAQGWDQVVFPGSGSRPDLTLGITWCSPRKTKLEVDGAGSRSMKVRSEPSRQPPASRRLRRARFENDLGFDLRAALLTALEVAA